MKRVADKIRFPTALLAVYGMAVVAAGNTAAVLREVTGSGSTVGGGTPTNPDGTSNSTDMLGVINGLLSEALVITVVIAPLAICWGAGMLMFSTRGGGGQIMASAVIAVVLVFGAKGIAA